MDSTVNTTLIIIIIPFITIITITIIILHTYHLRQLNHSLSSSSSLTFTIHLSYLSLLHVSHLPSSASSTFYTIYLPHSHPLRLAPFIHYLLSFLPFSLYTPTTFDSLIIFTTIIIDIYHPPSIPTSTRFTPSILHIFYLQCLLSAPSPFYTTYLPHYLPSTVRPFYPLPSVPSTFRMFSSTYGGKIEDTDIPSVSYTFYPYPFHTLPHTFYLPPPPPHPLPSL